LEFLESIIVHNSIVTQFNFTSSIIRRTSDRENSCPSKCVPRSRLCRYL